MRGRPDDLRLADPRGLAAAVRRDGDQPAQGGRRRRSSARPTWTSSRWAPPPSTRPTARRTTRGTSSGSRAAPAAARPRRSPRSRRRWRSAPTPAARSASRRPSPAPSASSRPTAACRATGSSRSRPPSTRPGRARAPCSTPRCCTRSIAGHDPLDSTSVDAAGAGRGRGGAPRATCAGCGSAWSASSAARATRPACSSASTRPSRCWATLGAEVVEVVVPALRRTRSAAYYLILPSEASSNLAKFDGDALRPAGRRRRDRVGRAGHGRAPATPASATR